MFYYKKTLIFSIMGMSLATATTLTALAPSSLLKMPPFKTEAARSFWKLCVEGKDVSQAFTPTTSFGTTGNPTRTLADLENPAFNWEAHNFIWSVYPKYSRGISGEEGCYLTTGIQPTSGQGYSLLDDFSPEHQAWVLHDIRLLRNNPFFRARLQKNDDLYLKHLGVHYDTKTQSIVADDQTKFDTFMQGHNNLRLSRRFESLLIFGEIERATAMKIYLEQQFPKDYANDTVYWKSSYENNFKIYKRSKEIVLTFRSDDENAHKTILVIPFERYDPALIVSWLKDLAAKNMLLYTKDEIPLQATLSEETLLGLQNIVIATNRDPKDLTAISA